MVVVRRRKATDAVVHGHAHVPLCGAEQAGRVGEEGWVGADGVGEWGFSKGLFHLALLKVVDLANPR